MLFWLGCVVAKFGVLTISFNTVLWCTETFRWRLEEGACHAAYMYTHSKVLLTHMRTTTMLYVPDTQFTMYTITQHRMKVYPTPSTCKQTPVKVEWPGLQWWHSYFPRQTHTIDPHGHSLGRSKSVVGKLEPTYPSIRHCEMHLPQFRKEGMRLEDFALMNSAKLRVVYLTLWSSSKCNHFYNGAHPFSPLSFKKTSWLRMEIIILFTTGKRDKIATSMTWLAELSDKQMSQ